MNSANLPLKDCALHEREGLDNILQFKNVLATRAPSATNHTVNVTGNRVDVLVMPSLLSDLRLTNAGCAMRKVGVRATVFACLRDSLILNGEGSGRQNFEGWLAIKASRHSHWAAGGEWAGGRHLQHRGRVPVQGGEGRIRLRIRPRQCAEQTDCVRHMRTVENIVDRTGLNNTTRVHHGHFVGHSCDNTQVVGDHDDRRACLLL